jgi:hypothetical protein
VSGLPAHHEKILRHSEQREESPFVLRYYSVMPTARTTAAPSPLRGFQRLWRTLRQIFYEAVGAMFGILAFAWLNMAFRSWTRAVNHWLIAASVAVALLFVFFAFSSFRRARSL